MFLGIVSVLPELLRGALSEGVVSRAIKQGILRVEIFNPRDFTADRHHTVDDRPYGGGAGMVMMVEPLRRALEAARAVAPEHTPVVLMSPQGKVLTQDLSLEYSRRPGLILVCGRYEGIDERFIDAYVDAQWSIGDYVLSGGELPALVVLDAIARHVPGTVGNQQSIIDESHLDGTLDYPHYTRPVDTDAGEVPEVLLSGDHKRVSDFRRREALARTLARRPDMLTGRVFDERDQRLLKELLKQEA